MTASRFSFAVHKSSYCLRRNSLRSFTASYSSIAAAFIGPRAAIFKVMLLSIPCSSFKAYSRHFARFSSRASCSFIWNSSVSCCSRCSQPLLCLASASSASRRRFSPAPLLRRKLLSSCSTPACLSSSSPRCPANSSLPPSVSASLASAALFSCASASF